jgi:hypothetical protein
MSWQAQARRDECWWSRCRLPAATIQVTFDSAEPGTIKLCGLHGQVVRQALDRGGYELEMWQAVGGLPVLVLQRVAA